MMDKERALPPDGGRMDKRRRVLRAVLCLGGFLAVCAALYFAVGRPMIRFAGDTERFRAWAGESGVWARLAFIGMMSLQIIVAVIPGEPLEIAAGCAFGAVEGTALCMLGALIGGVAVFLFVRRFGLRFVNLFFSTERLMQLPLLREPRRLNLLALILFLIPGTPKDILTYCAGLTAMRLPVWMGITSLARFPSIITSTLGGDALGAKKYGLAAVVFAVTILLSVAGLVVYGRLASKKRGQS
ncbi:MAG: TVP38/TMEM64 family protein [Clostridia bacterium]|nr:TVP38/TMEM64 family protein [Clostridia bacterium]